MNEILGGCRCGRVRYGSDAKQPPVVYACHCKHCQTWSGSAFALHALVPAAQLHMTGAVERYDDVGPNGETTTRAFCSTCRTRLYNVPAGMDDWMVLSAGTFDHSGELKPVLHMWTSRKHPWVVLPTGIPSFPTTPSPSAFFEAASASLAPGS